MQKEFYRTGISKKRIPDVQGKIIPGYDYYILFHIQLSQE